MTIQRYELTIGVNPFNGARETYRHAFNGGDYVLYADHLARVAELEREVERLNRCHTVAMRTCAIAQEERDALKARLEASERIRKMDYLPWTDAGGPNECKHGIAEGIHCRRCDIETLTPSKEADNA